MWNNCFRRKIISLVSNDATSVLKDGEKKTIEYFKAAHTKWQSYAAISK